MIDSSKQFCETCQEHHEFGFDECGAPRQLDSCRPRREQPSSKQQVEPSITQEQADRYVTEGESCPKCGSRSFEWLDPQLAGPRLVVAPVQCEECDHEWFEAYRMYGIGDEMPGGFAIRTFEGDHSETRQLTALYEIRRIVEAQPGNAMLSDLPALVQRLKDRVATLEAIVTLRPASEWHDDLGPVLWWDRPLVEPPYVGSPLCEDWPGYHTHWTSLDEISRLVDAGETHERCGRSVAPSGWWCSRERGHKGPCAAHPAPAPAEDLDGEPPARREEHHNA